MDKMGKIKQLLKINKIVVETRLSTDVEEKTAERAYYVWENTDGELDSTYVGGDTLFGDEARDVLSEYGYDGDSESVYFWSYSEYDSYKTKEDYDKAGWFFVEKSGRFNGTYFLG